MIRNGAPSGKRSELFQACVWHLAAKRMSIAGIVAEMAKYPNGIAAKYVTEKRLRGEVERSYEKWQESRRPSTPKSSTPGSNPNEPLIWDATDKTAIRSRRQRTPDGRCGRSKSNAATTGFTTSFWSRGIMRPNNLPISTTPP